ncbi:MAG: TPM domain-containing protein [Prevotella sp.]|nr:TPM domain-containing protein [Prevotella sp.]
METTFFYFLAYIALLVAGGFAVTRKWEDAPTTALAKKTEDMNQLTNRYNEVIKALEDSFSQEDLDNWSAGIGTSYTKHQYSKKYQKLAQEYAGKRRELLVDWAKSHPLWAKARRTWGWIFVIGLLSAPVSCIGDMASQYEEEADGEMSAAMEATDTKYWNARNIPMPHLQDATQYVSNPDHVLTQSTVDSMNITLQRLDTELGIESVVIIVNHIENDDPFRMAQDVGNHYGVGRDDRGLVIAVGFQDHSINMSPGKKLEGDLTDAECHRLEQRYVIPAMRANKPDSAMLYLTSAVYSLLQKKEMPQMSSLMDSEDNEEDTGWLMGQYLLFFIGWCIFFLRLNRKYQWIGMAGSVGLLANPFLEMERGSSGGGFGGFSGGGGSFGGGGGSFGGGSFGGGGATSRW